MSRKDQNPQAGLPLVAIVGRPNVGKSSLFNRLTGQRRAIVTNEPGITRDRLYGAATWQDKSFEVVDTGGLLPDEDAAIPQEILRQAQVAIEAAAALVLVVDARVGPTPLDEDLARLLRRSGKPVVLAANKVDTPRLADSVLVFHQLGIEPVIPISAEHGLGVDDLLEHVTQNWAAAETPTPAATLNVALIGRPNVGKSTLLNQLLGSERAIVTAEPGTTRDAVDTLVPAEGAWWRLIDTAGIRRKGKTRLLAEKLSVIMARKHLERADVAVLLLDATEGITKQDAAIGGYANDSGCSVLLTINKWDAIRKDSHSTTEWTQRVRRRLKFLDYAPVVFISALTGQRVEQLRKLITEAGAARTARLTSKQLREFLRDLPLGRATVPGGRRPKLYMLKQVGSAPPSFLLSANLPKLYFSFQRFLENQLRERFGFQGTPIRLRLAPRPRWRGKKSPTRKKSTR